MRPVSIHATHDKAHILNGYFRYTADGTLISETRSVGMLTFDDEGARAAAVAARLHGLLEDLGVYEREKRPWLPHVTVLRFRKAPGLEPALPDLGTVVPSDAAVYISRLRPGGAEYEVLESVELET